MNPQKVPSKKDGKNSKKGGRKTGKTRQANRANRANSDPDYKIKIKKNVASVAVEPYVRQMGKVSKFYFNFVFHNVHNICNIYSIYCIHSILFSLFSTQLHEAPENYS